MRFNTLDVRKNHSVIERDNDALVSGEICRSIYRSISVLTIIYMHAVAEAHSLPQRQRERQSARMSKIINDSLSRSDTRCFI